MTNFNLRLLPPTDPHRQTINVGPRRYSAAPGSYVDSANLSDAATLLANGWLRPDVRSSGPTSARPTVLEDGITRIPAGYGYVDTTLAAVVIYDGATWRNPATGASV